MADTAHEIKRWDQRVDWTSNELSTRLMVVGMKQEIAELRAALASRPAEVDDRTPRPISTAPHDGTEVLAWSKTGKTWHQVYWKTQEHGNWLWEKPFPPRWACRWNSDYYQGQNEFSHWLPIPGAPSHTTNKEK